MQKIKSFLPKLYIIWSILAISITFIIGKLSNDNITHILILIILILSLIIFRFLKPTNPKSFFIISGVILAALGEGTYMISKPVLDNLLVQKGSTFATFFHNYVIDLALTLPVYVLIFYVIWILINKFKF